MDMKTAFTQARKMKSFFRAFEQMEEVIAVAVAAEAQAVGLGREIQAKKNRLETLRESVEAAEAATHEAEVRSMEALRAGEATVAAADRDAKEQVEEKRVETTEALAELTVVFSDAQNKHDIVVAALRDEVAGLERAKKELEDALDGLKSRVEKA
tara:strand:- start:6939 stop:7403 length:465 start_codon:yes stop_codon:yes gene_type:complete